MASVIPVSAVTRKTLVCVVAILWSACPVACRRHRVTARAPRERDPRQQFATGCEDPRFVLGRRLVGVPRESVSATRAVPVRVGGRDVVVAATADGVRAWRASPDDAVDAGEAQGVWVSRDVATSLSAAELGARAAVVAHASARGVTLTLLDDVARPLLDLSWATDVSVASVGARAMAVASGGGRVELVCVDALRGARGCGVVTSQGADAVVTAAGAGFGVAWREGDRVRVQPRGLDGAARAPAFDAVTSQGVGRVAMAYGGGRFALAWSDRRGGDVALHSASVSPWGGAARDVQRLSVRFDASAVASIAWDGGAFGVAWWEPIAGGHPRSYMAFVGRDGMRIGTQMRVYLEDDAPLRAPVLHWASPNYALAAVRGDGAVETRRMGPLGCDEPIDR